MFYSCSKPTIQPSVVHVNFADQPSLNIADNYFTIPFAASDSGMIGAAEWRFDLTGNFLTRYWHRVYDNMSEVRVTLIYPPTDWRSRSYLFGIKSGRAFYIYWENDPFPHNPERKKHPWYPCYSSDLNELTVKIETNLPEEIIKKYYPRIWCAIIVRSQNS